VLIEQATRGGLQALGRRTGSPCSSVTFRENIRTGNRKSSSARLQIDLVGGSDRPWTKFFIMRVQVGWTSTPRRAPFRAWAVHSARAIWPMSIRWRSGVHRGREREKTSNFVKARSQRPGPRQRLARGNLGGSAFRWHADGKKKSPGSIRAAFSRPRGMGTIRSAGGNAVDDGPVGWQTLAIVARARRFVTVDDQQAGPPDL